MTTTAHFSDLTNLPTKHVACARWQKRSPHQLIRQTGGFSATTPSTVEIWQAPQWLRENFSEQLANKVRLAQLGCD